jgi:hypothetical protein
LFFIVRAAPAGRLIAFIVRTAPAGRLIAFIVRTAPAGRLIAFIVRSAPAGRLIAFIVRSAPAGRLIAFIMRSAPAGRLIAFIMRSAPAGRLIAFIMRTAPAGRLIAFIVRSAPAGRPIAFIMRAALVVNGPVIQRRANGFEQAFFHHVIDDVFLCGDNKNGRAVRVRFKVRDKKLLVLFFRAQNDIRVARVGDQIVHKKVKRLSVGRGQANLRAEQRGFAHSSFSSSIMATNLSNTACDTASSSMET